MLEFLTGLAFKFPFVWHFKVTSTFLFGEYDFPSEDDYK